MDNNDGYNGASFQLLHNQYRPSVTEVMHKNSALYRRSVLGQLDTGEMGDLIGIGRGDLAYLEIVLSSFPKLTNLVELGTWYGYTALWLGMIARLRGGLLATFDIVDLRTDDVKRAWLNNMSFRLGSVFDDKLNVVENLASAPNTFLFVDNGDKPREMHLFAHKLQSGSVVAVHDWPLECGPADIPDMSDFSELHWGAAELLSSSVRAWVKK